MTGAEIRRVLLLNGGKAFGDYQAGAFEAIQEEGFESRPGVRQRAGEHQPARPSRASFLCLKAVPKIRIVRVRPALASTNQTESGHTSRQNRRSGYQLAENRRSVAETEGI
jgi:hypothetical protein